MRIGILTPTQSIHRPPDRWVKKKEVKVFLAAGTITYVIVDGVAVEHLYRMVAKKTLPNTDKRFATCVKDRKVTVTKTEMHQLKKAQKPINLDLYYPEKGRTSVRHPHEAFVLACEEAQRLKDVE